jgi:hypothetical protein
MKMKLLDALRCLLALLLLPTAAVRASGVQELISKNHHICVGNT